MLQVLDASQSELLCAYFTQVNEPNSNKKYVQKEARCCSKSQAAVKQYRCPLLSSTLVLFIRGGIRYISKVRYFTVFCLNVAIFILPFDAVPW